jgi:pimeloyl-ACP methyl ester carboxylesterase
MPNLLPRADINFNRALAREISLRETVIGGPPRRSAWLFPPKLLQRGRRMLLMIHGFNVSLCQAGCAFEKFEANLNLYWRARSVSLYWPGDVQNWFAFSRVRKGLPTKAWSAVNYPRQIGHARQCAQLLLDSFRAALSARAAQPPMELVIVAHSLGCRLTLEFLQRLIGAGLKRAMSIPLVVLMAAAVPRYLVRPGAPLARAIRLPKKVVVYKSRSDLVLTGAFRPGQILEWSVAHGLNPLARGAIGRQGCGPQIPRKIREIEGDRGHSDYWPDNTIAAKMVDDLEAGAASVDLLRRIELRRRPSGRVVELRTLDGRRLSSRPVGRRGLRRVCKEC